LSENWNFLTQRIWYAHGNKNLVASTNPESELGEALGILASIERVWELAFEQVVLAST
jgi:hypothetical protein